MASSSDLPQHNAPLFCINTTEDFFKAAVIFTGSFSTFFAKGPTIWAKSSSKGLSGIPKSDIAFISDVDLNSI